jgi:uncharacterized membrane protein
MSVRNSVATFGSRRERYALLLGVLVLSFAVQGISTPGPGEQVLVTVLLATALQLAWWTADAKPQVMRISLALGVVVIVASIAEAAAGSVDGVASRLANMLVVALAPPAVVVGVGRSLRARGQVTVATVYGVLCLYILIGMFFAFVFGAIDHLGHAFFAQDVDATVSNCLYFSFTTLTTVGYGDLTAATNLGHTLSVTEALTGQIYLVTVVSVIVSNLGRAPSRDP